MRRVFAGGLAAGLLVTLLSGCVGTGGPVASDGAGAVVPAAQKKAAETATAPTPTASAPAGGSAGGGDGDGAGGGDATGADALPQGLQAALSRDLGLSPEQYLADAAAAGHASDIAPALQEAGIALDQVWLDGSTINVHTTTAAQASAAESLGAEPTTQAPPTAEDIDLQQQAAAYDNLDNGSGWFLRLGGTAISVCSIGFNGFASNGAPTAATAGHCLLANSPVPTAPVDASRYLQSVPNQQGTDGGVIGALNYSSFMFGNGNDSGLIQVTAAGLTPRSQTSTWNGGTVPVRGIKTATVGAPICKSGRTTGWTCGKVLEVNYPQSIEGGVTVNSVATSMCMYHGDSGGAAMIGNYAVGINSSGTWSSISCADSRGYSAIYPLTGASDSLTQKQPGWQIQVTLDAPVITATVGGATPTVSGTAPNATTGTYVSVYVDGSSTASGSAPIAANGTWSVAPTGLAAGVHTITAVATYGSFNRSAASATAYLPVAIASTRVYGQDRYLTSIAASKSSYPTHAPVVYIANGLNFPDALVSSAAAVKAGGPVLLNPPTSVPQAVLDEIARLAPSKIVLVGGTGSLSPAVAAALQGKAATVTRVSGGDRYETARNIVSAGFGAGPVANLYVASGAGFPDSLSAAAAAAATGVPVLTVRGDVSSLDAATVAAINTLKPQKITIVGGTGAMTTAIENQLKTLTPTVTRLGGIDRYTTSQVVAKSVYSTASSVFIASGATFPDALTGSGAAGAAKKPLLITPGTCANVNVTQAMNGWHSTAMTLIGGPAGLTANVETLRSC